MIKGVLLDIAGVLYDGDRPVPGSAEAVERLRAAGLPIRCVTNSTRNPRSVIVEKLDAMGFGVAAEDVFTPAAAACDLLRERGRAAHLLIHPDLEEDFAGLSETSGDRTVVIGDAADGFTYASLNVAFRELTAGADLMALASNRSFNDSDGELSLDAGAFVAALEYASGKEAEIVGKPAPAFFESALSSMGVAADAAVMVGDDAQADVAGALRAGIGQAVLVRTGKYRDGDETRASQAPSHLAENLAAAVDWVLG